MLRFLAFTHLIFLSACFPKVNGLSVTSSKPVRAFPEYRGKTLVLYFGYTHCPDICPLMLYKLKQARSLLPFHVRERVQVLMISLDPEHDTQEGISQYVQRFDPTFLGKLLDNKEIQDVSYALGITSVQGEAGYLEHLAYAIVLDRWGIPRILFSVDLSPQEMAADLKTVTEYRIWFRGFRDGSS